VNRLDCQDIDSTLVSLASIVGVDVSAFSEAILDYDDSHSGNRWEDEYRRLPRELLVGLDHDVDAISVDAAFYFHGSRVSDPSCFSDDGILPLDRIHERVWSTLYEFVRDEVGRDEWTAFRASVEDGGGDDDGLLYRLKTSDRRHFGPYAALVRETLTDPSSTASHDYLRCPEIVQDIARCFQSDYGIDLEARFCEATRPVIVKFESSKVWEGAFATALWYAFAKLRYGRHSHNATGGFDGEGERVQPAQIVDVEIVA
jgi:hypothetical protein